MAGQHTQHQHNQASRGFLHDPAPQPGLTDRCTAMLGPEKDTGECSLGSRSGTLLSQLAGLGSPARRNTCRAGVAPCSALLQGWEALPDATLPNHSGWHAGSREGHSMHPGEQGRIAPCQQTLQPWVCREAAQWSVQGLILCAKVEAGPQLEVQLRPSTRSGSQTGPRPVHLGGLLVQGQRAHACPKE